MATATTLTLDANTDNLKVNCHNLGLSYNLWYHNPDDLDWSPESYNEILNFNTIEEFWILDKFIRKDMVENGMFYVMKDGILPLWEDPQNIKGGCVSWKIERNNSYKYWIDIVGHFLMKDLGNYTDKVNGVSVSPKKNACIIKLWFSEEIDINKIVLPTSLILKIDKVIFKTHIQNIDKDKTKRNLYN